jgi:hypothetical protein
MSHATNDSVAADATQIDPSLISDIDDARNKEYKVYSVTLLRRSRTVANKDRCLTC